jgi:hypothetical protein
MFYKTHIASPCNEYTHSHNSPLPRYFWGQLSPLESNNKIYVN